MKATLPGPDATSPKKAKAELRPSSVALKNAPPAKAVKATASGKAEGRGNHKPAPSTASAISSKSTSTKARLVEPATSKATVVKPPAAKATAAKPAAARPAPLKPAAAKAATSPPAAANGTRLTRPASSKSKPAEPPPSSAPPAKKPARKSIKEAAGVSTDAVARRTGKTWDDWFEVLDTAGAATLDQRGIIAILAQKHGIGPWWQQMIAVGYESLRGKSEKPASPEGFQISTSCTLAVPVRLAFKSWNDAGERARWLSDDRFVVRSATPEKVLRARWGKGNSHVAVSFSEKAGQTEVAVEHQQIESRAAAEQMKAYWEKKLGLLTDALSQRR